MLLIYKLNKFFAKILFKGSVLEGMYWKRRMEAVCAQYKRWRTYNRYARKKPRNCCRKRVKTNFQRI